MTTRKLLLLLGATLLGAALLELGARLEYRTRTGEPFPKTDAQERLAPGGDADLVLRQARAPEPEGDVEEPALVGNKALHPYTGYVHDHSGARRTTNWLGYPGLNPLWPRAEGEVRIAITGGSVALQLYKEGGALLHQRLAEHPAFAGRRVRLVALTLGGYKQPQQLMSLAWLLSLGARFDVVINLDGFNEVVLPYTDNLPGGVHPAFPRSWKLFAQKSLDGAEIDGLLALQQLRNERQLWRERLGTGWAAGSVFALRALERLDAGFARSLAEAEQDFRRALDEGELSYQVSGPPADFASEEELFRELVALWRSSSLQMHRLSDANGIAYFHFLQPNQYVPGAKPLSAEEKRVAVRPGPFGPKTAVRAAYGHLASAGAELASEGVAFTDLTSLFEAETRTVYRDSCCHLNRLGIDAIAERVAREVGEGLRAPLRAPHPGAERAPTPDAAEIQGAPPSIP